MRAFLSVWLCAAAVASAVAPAHAQGPELDEEADKARRAWLAHDATALVAGTSRVQIRLPGADPSGAIGPV